MSTPPTMNPSKSDKDAAGGKPNPQQQQGQSDKSGQHGGSKPDADKPADKSGADKK